MDKQTFVLKVNPYIPTQNIPRFDALICLDGPIGFPYVSHGSEKEWIGLLGKILTGNHRFSHEIYGFPVNFPLNQSIENNKKLWIPLIPKTIPKTEEPPGAVCGTPGAVDSALTSFATLVMYGSGILLGSPVAWRSRIGPGGQAWKIAVLNEEK